MLVKISPVNKSAFKVELDNNFQLLEIGLLPNSLLGKIVIEMKFKWHLK